MSQNINLHFAVVQLRNLIKKIQSVNVADVQRILSESGASQVGSSIHVLNSQFTTLVSELRRVESNILHLDGQLKKTANILAKKSRLEEADDQDDAEQLRVITEKYNEYKDILNNDKEKIIRALDNSKVTQVLGLLANVLHSVEGSAENSVGVHTLVGSLTEIVKMIDDVKSDLEVITRFVPDDETIQKNLEMNALYRLAETIGGTYIQLSQGMLPLTGAERDFSGSSSVKASGGICAGMVIVWGRQCVENGTPSYPVTSTLEALEAQENQKDIEIEEYKNVDNAQVVQTSEMNFCSLIADGLEPQIPYYVYIRNDTGAHAIGFRKHENCIEIFDPNLGYFFFPNANVAGMWFSALIATYQVTDFCSDTISLMARSIPAGVEVPKSSYPGTAMISRAAVEAVTDDGYIKVKKEIKELLEYIIDCKDNSRKGYDFVFKWLGHTLKHAAVLLDNEDRQKLIYTISHLKTENYDENAMTSLISESVYYALQDRVINAFGREQVYWGELENVVTAINGMPAANIRISPDVKTAIDHANRLAIEIRAEASECRYKLEAGDLNETESAKLRLQAAILDARLVNLLKREAVAEKLYAGSQGLQYYTVQDANNAMVRVNQNLPEHLEKSQMLINKIEILENRLRNISLSDEAIRDAIHHVGADPFSLDANIFNIKAGITSHLALLDKIKTLIPDEAQSREMELHLEKLRQDCPGFDQITAATTGEDIITGMVPVVQSNVDTCNSAKYTEAEIADMRRVYNELSRDDQGSIKYQIQQLTQRIQQDRDQYQEPEKLIELLNGYEQDRLNVRDMILHMLNPDSHLNLPALLPLQNFEILFNLVSRITNENTISIQERPVMPNQRYEERTINQIAEVVRRLHHLREFSARIDDKSGLIFYGAVPINYKKLERPIHGFQNTCRAAALIPHLLNLYMANVDAFQEPLRDEIQRLRAMQEQSMPSENFADEIKIMQIVAMMRSSGRRQGVKDQSGKPIDNPDHSNGMWFRDQSKKECEALLESLGVPPEKIEKYTKAIIECEDRDKGPDERRQGGKEPMSLLGCLLADAVMIENVRTRRSPSSKPDTWIHLRDFAVCKNSNGDVGLRQAFEQLVCKHVALIKKQQGFVMHALYDDHDRPIPGYPDLSKGKSKEGDEAWKAQHKIETSCTFSQIDAAVSAAQRGDLDAKYVAEPDYMVELRGYIDHGCADTEKRELLKNLYQRLRDAAGSGVEVRAVVEPWREQEAETLAKPDQAKGGVFAFLGKQPKSSGQFLDEFVGKHGAETLRDESAAGRRPVTS